MIDIFFQKLYWFAYRLRLFYNFCTCPDAYGVYIAVWVQDKILIIKNSYKSCYTIPCGGLHWHETGKQGAIRELYEEVNIKVSSDDLTFVGTYISCVENMTDYIIVYEVNLSELPDFKVDNREVIWANFEEPGKALKRDLFPTVRKYLKNKVGNSKHEN